MSIVGTNRPHDYQQEEDKGVLLCFRESDGKFLWQAVHDSLKDGTGAQNYGIVSSPCVDGNRVYYVNNRWEVICADAAGDGAKAKILWKLDMIKELKVFPGGISGSLSICSPLIVEDLVFVVTANGSEGKGKVPAPDAPSFIALDKKPARWSGRTIHPARTSWTASGPIRRRRRSTGNGTSISPAATAGCTPSRPRPANWCGSSTAIPRKPIFKAGGRGTRNYIVATPVIWENKLYHRHGTGSPTTATARAICGASTSPSSRKTRTRICRPSTTTSIRKPRSTRIPAWFGITAAPSRPSRKVWDASSFSDARVSTVAIHDGLLYAAELAGYLNCFDARTGKKHWEFDLKANTWSSPLYADGKVYMGTDDGSMFVFPHGKERKKPTKIDMSDALLSPPTAVNGVLYVSNGSNLFAIAAK